MKSETIQKIRGVLDMLADGKYADIEALTHGRKLSASQMKGAIEDYGRTLVRIPSDKLELDAVQVTGRAKPTWSVRIDLWTEEEGRSDLTLELTVEEGPGGNVTIRIDDIRVP